MTDTYLATYTESYGNPSLGAVTIGEFRSFVGASIKKTDDELARVLLLANALIDRFCGTRKTLVPQAVLNAAVLQVGQALYFRELEGDNTRSNQYSADGSFVQTLPYKDVMHFAYPLLRPYVGWF